MTELGRVVEVSAEEYGSPLASDHLAGATVLNVVSAVDFYEDGGEITYPDPVDESGLPGARPYSTCDKDANTISLSLPLAEDVPRDTFVRSWRVAFDETEAAESDYIAQVMIDDEDEPVSARVPHHLRDRLPEGVREEDEQEAVEIWEDAGGEWYISQVYGAVPRNYSASTGVFLTANQVVPGSGVGWGRVLWDVGSGGAGYFRSISTATPEFIEVPLTGRYLLIANVRWTPETGGSSARRARIIVKNLDTTVETVLRETWVPYAGAGSGGTGLSQFQVVTSRVLTAGHVIALDVWQESSDLTLALFGAADGSATALELTHIAQT